MYSLLPKLFECITFHYHSFSRSKFTCYRITVHDGVLFRYSSSTFPGFKTAICNCMGNFFLDSKLQSATVYSLYSNTLHRKKSFASLQDSIAGTN